MSAFYDDLQNVAISMIAEFGTTIVHKPYAVSPGDYDESTGLVTPVTGTSFNRLALLTEQPGNRINRMDGQVLQDGSLVQRSDKWVYMCSDAQAPKLQDVFTVNGFDYACCDVQVHSPSGQDLLYLVVMRK